MTMNYEMLETYVKVLAKQEKWKDLIATKHRIIKHYRESKQVDHRTRRSFIEIISVQILTEDFYKVEDSLDQFFKEVGGNAYSHDEYCICDSMKDAVTKKDWDALEEIIRKPMF